jgi:histone acetyltransferase (RNA polymerase elongator complex component)
MPLKILPLFIPHAGCPHRCVFCDQERITGSHGPPLDLSRIKTCIGSFFDRHPPKAGPVQAAFYGGNFLGLS